MISVDDLFVRLTNIQTTNRKWVSEKEEFQVGLSMKDKLPFAD